MVKELSVMFSFVVVIVIMVIVVLVVIAVIRYCFIIVIVVVIVIVMAGSLLGKDKLVVTWRGSEDLLIALTGWVGCGPVDLGVPDLDPRLSEGALETG